MYPAMTRSSVRSQEQRTGAENDDPIMIGTVAIPQQDPQKKLSLVLPSIPQAPPLYFKPTPEDYANLTSHRVDRRRRIISRTTPIMTNSTTTTKELRFNPRVMVRQIPTVAEIPVKDLARIWCQEKDFTQTRQRERKLQKMLEVASPVEREVLQQIHGGVMLTQDEQRARKQNMRAYIKLVLSEQELLWELHDGDVCDPDQLAECSWKCTVVSTRKAHNAGARMAAEALEDLKKDLLIQIHHHHHHHHDTKKEEQELWPLLLRSPAGRTKEYSSTTISSCVLTNSSTLPRKDRSDSIPTTTTIPSDSPRRTAMIVSWGLHQQLFLDQ